jgi:hypothetical protein
VCVIGNQLFVIAKKKGYLDPERLNHMRILLPGTIYFCGGVS